MTPPSTQKLSLQHLSIRVPWHDNGWTGGICNKPLNNSSCLILKRIREERKDTIEFQNAGKYICDIPPDQWPPCVPERGMFMAPFEYVRMISHPYSKSSSAHKHIQPTTYRHPPYSAAAVPFRWMSRDFAWDIARLHEIDISQDREPTEPAWLERNGWVQAGENQKALLDCFFSAIEPLKSLCFFYAKQTPLLDEGDWVLIGAGRVKSVGQPTEYNYDTKSLKNIRSFLWDVSIEHSIRPDFKDGFILPYHEILKKSETDSSIDTSEFVALIPEDRRIEFAYASEHVTHDGAIAALLSCKESLERSNEILDKPLSGPLRWIDERLSELWKYRGAYPGIGSALSAFGINHGVMVAHHISNNLGENEDPWPIIDNVFKNPGTLPKHIAKEITPTLQSKWKNIKPERLALLKLLSRFEITNSQVKRYYIQEEREKRRISCPDEAILSNPYIIYESDRFADTRNDSENTDPISLWTVDRGLYPPPAILNKHPIPDPSALEGPLDPRRIRSLTIFELEKKAQEGHTLLPRNHVITSIRSLPIDPPCEADGDLFDIIGDSLHPEVLTRTMADGKPSLQLQRYEKTRELIRHEVLKRVKGKRFDIIADWPKILDDSLKSPSDNPEEQQAREEKSRALAEIAASRFSVLIGPAGTGKTTVLASLCSHPSIASGGILLLAPTGKARVRLGQKCGIQAKTIAQFLAPSGRYNGVTGQYVMNDEKRFEGAKTVIIDESSMLTEEMLASVFNGLKGVERFILSGDHSQLPPIGAGRPFVDIISQLTPDGIESQKYRIGQSYAELTIQRRQIGKNLEDIQLAKWFSSRLLAPGEDDIWSKISSGKSLDRIRFVEWNTPEELPLLLINILIEELRLSGPDDQNGFEAWNGGSEFNGKMYFRREAGIHAEDWQILTPFRNVAIGSRGINRLVQKGFRQQVIDWARRYGGYGPKITEPRGTDEIVYGDKVINVSNHLRKSVYPKEGALNYVANGEIGIVTGEYIPAKYAKGVKPQYTRVEFSSQPGYEYSYRSRDIGEDNALLELAYAITIHKAQGSEFDLTFLIIPSESQMMSRELLYTSLTRQRKRIVILHQGPVQNLRNYTSAESSATASRITNLFVPPNILEERDPQGKKPSRYYEHRLIHRTARGEMVRSKSEVIIDDALFSAGIKAEYENEFLGGDGTLRLPDFTIQDDASGITYLWEHLGMLGDPGYKHRWEETFQWYKNHGVKTLEEGGGDRATLIITSDTPQGAIDAQAIQKIIKEVLV